MRSASGAHAILRRVERLLFAVAAVALVWYAMARIDAAREQAALSNELSALAAMPATSSRPGAPARTHAPHPPATRDLVGRIDLPRLRLSALAREGVDTRTLRGSVGHVPGSAL